MKNIIFYKHVFCLLALFLLAAAGFRARGGSQDYVGASALLQQVEEQNAKAFPKTNDEGSQLKDDLKMFEQNSATLAPTDAAQRWLGLVDRTATIMRQEGQSFNPTATPITGNDLLAALPPPAAWSDLDRAIIARPPPQDSEQMREMGLRLLAAALTGDAGKRDLEIRNMESQANETDQAAYIYRSLFQQLGQTMLAASDDPNTILGLLEGQLSSAGSGNAVPLQLPNLVSLVGPEKAEAFLRKALVSPNVTLMIEEPNETSHMAQKLALELIDQMKVPQWGLVNSLDAVALYEALDKHFGNQTNISTGGVGALVGFNFSPPDFSDNSPKQIAQVYYMLGLISQDRTKDAVAIAKEFRGSSDYQFDVAFEAMDRAGYAVELDNFFYQLLSQNPSLPFWSQYVEFAAKAGQTDRMLALVRATLQRTDLSDNKKYALHQILFSALLAADNLNEGVQEISRLIATNRFSLQSRDNYSQGLLGVTLARIGILVNRPEWTEEGVVAAKKWLATPADQNPPDWQAGEVVSSLTEILQELNRGPEAESILAAALANAIHPGNAQADDQWYGWSPVRQDLTDLVTLYYKAGRYDDVLEVLQDSPDWGVKDLSDLFNSDSFDEDFSITSLHMPSSSLPVPYMAAEALIAKGRIPEARRITDALLDNQPGLDRGYELLISLEGTNAISRLDALFAVDQFQPRPLIWKAHLLQQEGRLEEAEKTVRQAITIDPSDGQEGRGDRMRAYAELADILEARGNSKEAMDDREIVKAIRVSEDADQFYKAGLLKRAIAMYQQGLDHFADAYCIQSRMAIQLAAVGKNAEAAEHYRRAYELMPDSFGRVESHCFGCERVFDGGQAQGIAEKVFVQLVAERPSKPQVYYLLGYLQTEEDRYNQAWTNFQTAVHLDPDYLNAWVKMQEISRQILLSPGERDEIAFNILRLDPLQRHSQPDFAAVNDLPRLWNAVAVTVPLQPAPATNLLALTASKIALEKNPNASNDQSIEVRMMESDNQDQNLSPAQAIAQTPYVNLAGQLILNGVFSTINE